MADQVSTLGLAVDTSGLKQADSALDKVTQAGDKTALSLDRVESLLSSIDASSRSVAQALAAAAQSTREVSNTTKAADDAGRRLLETIREQSALYGKSAEDVLRYRAAQAGVSAEAAPLILQLQNQRAAQQRAAEAALAEAQAQREAAQAKASAERAQQSFLASLKEQADTLNFSRVQLLEYRAAQLGVSEQAAPLIKRLGDLGNGQKNLGAASRLAAFEAQQLAFQMNDLFVQIASGGSPLTAIIQQGSQLAGTFGGIGGAARAAAGFVLGLVNPLTLAVGATAALAVAYEKGQAEGREFNKTLILTGNAAGTTADQLASMAKQVNQLGAGTVGRAAEVLNQLAGTGKVAASSLASFTNAALQMERSGGDAAEKTVAAFAELGKSPLQASLKLNESTNYLTRSTYEQIRALEQQGRTIEAARVAQQAYADALNQRTPQMEQNIGLLERAWRAVKEATKGAADAALNVGRPQTLDDISSKLAAVRAQRADAEANGTGLRRSKVVLAELDAEEKKLQKQYDIQLGIEAAEMRKAELASEQAKQIEKRAKWDEEGVQYLTRREQLERAIVRARNEAPNDATEAELQQRIAQLRRQFDPGAQQAPLLAAIDDTKRNLASLVEAYQNAESVLDANRQAGLVGERDYYDAKIGFLKLNAEAQRRILEEDVKAQRVLLQQPDLNTSERTAIQTRIKDDLAEISRLQERAAVSGANFATAQTSAQRALSAALADTRNQAELYLQAMQRANRRDLEGFGLGSEERNRRAGRNQISDKYDDDRARVQAEINALIIKQDGELTAEQAQRYTEQLNLISEFKDKALTEYDDYYTKRRAQEADASYGSAEALANWVDTNRNAARTMQEAYEHTFASIEDTLAEFFKTGKRNVKSLSETIINEMARVQSRKLLASALGTNGEDGWFGKLFGAAVSYFGGQTVDTSSAGSTAGINGGSYLPDSLRGGRAIGGPVSAGQTYEVNERDIPEIARVGGRDYLTMGGKDGKVIPLGDVQGGSHQSITVHVQMPENSSRQTAQQFGAQIARQISRASRRNN